MRSLKTVTVIHELKDKWKIMSFVCFGVGGLQRVWRVYLKPVIDSYKWMLQMVIEKEITY